MMGVWLVGTINRTIQREFSKLLIASEALPDHAILIFIPVKLIDINMINSDIIIDTIHYLRLSSRN